jgi:hypothetical protein
VRRLPTLVIAVDGTLIAGVRRLLRAGAGTPGWRETVRGVVPLFDSATQHLRKSTVPADESDARLLDTEGLRDAIDTYIETVDLQEDLRVFVEDYVTSGGEVLLVLPPLIAHDAILGRRLREKLSGIPASIRQVVGLDVEAIDDESLVVVARTDEVRTLIREGKHAIAYVNVSRLTRELQMRINVKDSAAEGGASEEKENQS